MPDRGRMEEVVECAKMGGRADCEAEKARGRYGTTCIMKAVEETGWEVLFTTD